MPCYSEDCLLSLGVFGVKNTEPNSLCSEELLNYLFYALGILKISVVFSCFGLIILLSVTEKAQG